MDTRKLLGYLVENIVGDKYKVFDKSELTAVSPSAEEELNMLKTNGYVVIKYADEEEVCLCVTVSGRAAAEKNADNAVRETAGAEESLLPVKVSLWHRWKTAVIAAVSGLFGGVIGGAIIYLILSVAA